MNDPLQDRKILVIDDDPEILEFLDLLITRAGARAVTASTAAEGLRQFYAFRPDLVILDLMMPHMSGWDVCGRIRELSDVPVMMLTALADTRDIARGLESGADDYLTKPFASQVLLARMRALLRRSMLAESLSPSHTYDDGHLTIDLERRQVLVRQEPVKLTPTEYRLLSYLFQHPDRSLPYSQILENVWGPECADCTHYVHVYLHRLRQKLEVDPDQPRYLLTEPGIGCRFDYRLGPNS
jgi:two-component system KDP operon response regulator KdpE